MSGSPIRSMYIRLQIRGRNSFLQILFIARRSSGIGIDLFLAAPHSQGLGDNVTQRVVGYTDDFLDRLVRTSGEGSNVEIFGLVRRNLRKIVVRHAASGPVDGYRAYRMP